MLIAHIERSKQMTKEEFFKFSEEYLYQKGWFNSLNGYWEKTFRCVTRRPLTIELALLVEFEYTTLTDFINEKARAEKLAECERLENQNETND